MTFNLGDRVRHLPSDSAGTITDFGCDSDDCTHRSGGSECWTVAFDDASHQSFVRESELARV